MIKFFSNNKIIFNFFNFSLIFMYIFPGSLPGQIIYGDKRIQPQIIPDLIISSNHFFVFILLALIGFFTFIKLNQIKYLVIYLISISIALELLHLVIPERSFQWSDLFGNLFGVFIVIFIRRFIKLI